MSGSTTKPTPRRWVSLADAAEHLGITERTARRLVATGALPAFRVGPRLIRVDLADADAMMSPIPTTSGAGDSR